jgi:hypothetical protein
VPILGYRAYALWRAAYLVEMGGLKLRWGLREEDIPMDAILWVRSGDELESSLPLPVLRLPGAVLGPRRTADGILVEYLAARPKGLVLIGTQGRVFAVSPADPGRFIQTYRRMAEYLPSGSFPARSAYPSFLIGRVWAERPARILLSSGLILAAILLVLVSLSIPARQTVSLGFDSDGTPTAGVPAVQLLLLPLLNGFFYLAEVLLGLFFFRRESGSDLAYLLWGSSILTGVLFLSALYFILNAG